MLYNGHQYAQLIDFQVCFYVNNAVYMVQFIALYHAFLGIFRRHFHVSFAHLR